MPTVICSACLDVTKLDDCYGKCDHCGADIELCDDEFECPMCGVATAEQELDMHAGLCKDCYDNFGPADEEEDDDAD